MTPEEQANHYITLKFTRDHYNGVPFWEARDSIQGGTWDSNTLAEALSETLKVWGACTVSEFGGEYTLVPNHYPEEVAS